MTSTLHFTSLTHGVFGALWPWAGEQKRRSTFAKRTFSPGALLASAMWLGSLFLKIYRGLTWTLNLVLEQDFSFKASKLCSLEEASPVLWLKPP